MIDDICGQRLKHFAQARSLYPPIIQRINPNAPPFAVRLAPARRLCILLHAFPKTGLCLGPPSLCIPLHESGGNYGNSGMDWKVAINATLHLCIFFC
jgi:hypothetical protein